MSSSISMQSRSRLKLCQLMGGDINFLILDEPTNHLDIASREWIEDAVADYGGALLFVSHDRWFIERFANRIWFLENGEITDYRGSFLQFREYRERQKSIALAAVHKEEKTRAAGAVKKSAPSHGRKLALLEREIEKTEKQIAALDEESAANASDYQKLMELDAKKAELNEALEQLYLEWESLSEA